MSRPQIVELPGFLEARAGAPVALPRWDLDAIVSELRISRDVTHNIRHQGRIRRPPSRETLTDILDGISAALFPTHHSPVELGAEAVDYFVGATLNHSLSLLAEQVRLDLSITAEAETPEPERTQAALAITQEFAAGLASIRGVLVSDLRAAFRGDPAATNFPEILLAYPGMSAIIAHRLAHRLHRAGAPLLARLLSDIAHTRTGIDIHPGAQIGSGFFIDHGTGVVIGETTIIGEHVRLYQAVTLGARHFPADETGALVKGAPRHPIIEDDVVIYAGATILGRITIGRGSSIGGNIWLTRSVPPGSHITQANARSSSREE